MSPYLQHNRLITRFLEPINFHQFARIPEISKTLDRVKYFVILTTISLLTVFSLQGQNVTPRNLTPEQANELLELAESRNMSSAELRNFALSRGYAESDINSLLVRFEASVNSEQFGISEPLEGEEELLSEGADIERGLDQYSAIFGQSFFANSIPNFQPNSDISTPKDYIIGPKDEVNIEVYGAAQQSYELEVDNEGKIKVPRLGPVQVGGLSVEAIGSKLENELQKIFSGIRGPNPTVFVEVSVFGIRTITVNVVGEVETPGNYAISAFSNVLNALYQAGGPTRKGSMRSIKIFRGGKQLAVVDLYDFFIYGNNSADINLEDNDIILVDIYQERVDVKGQVKRPMQYEITGKETVEEIISWSGGLLSKADPSSIILLRDQGATQFVKDLELNDQVFPFNDGDKIWVKEVEDLNAQRVQVEGAVTVPGLYGWEEGMSVKDLLSKANGCAPDCDLGSATLFRKRNDLSPGLQSIALDVSSDTTKLLPGDLLVIPSLLTYSGFQYVQVSGAVLNETTMPYYEGMTAWDAVVLSGGIKNSAIGGKLEIVRKNDDSGSKYSIIEEEIDSSVEYGGKVESATLEAFDHIYVRTFPGFQEEAIVAIEGEVIHPGAYTLTSPNTSISEIISRAGGLNENAYAEGISLYRLGSKRREVKSETEIELERLEGIYQYLANTQANSVHNNQLQLIEERINDLREVYLIEKREEKRLEEEEQRLKAQSTLDDELEENDSYSELFQRVGISYKEAVENPGSEADIVLLPGDRIVVPRRPETVLVNGEVLHPTQARFLQKRTFKDYVSQAGGVTEVAKLGKSYVIYPNGEASRTKRFLFFRFYPKVEPGSEIIVPDGRNKFNVGTVSEIFGLLTSAASIVTTYILLQNLVDSQNSNP